MTSLRACANREFKDCDKCAFIRAFDNHIICADHLKLSAADALEKLLDRCARYAEEIAVLQERLKAYEDTGLAPEETLSMRMDMAIIKALFQDADVERLKELARADREGRVVVLPCKVGDTVIDQTFAENPTLMKNIRLEIAYESRCGIIFQMGYDTFADLVEHGRIKPVSEEAEDALRRAENG